MGVCNCSMFCCTLLYVHSSIALILMGKRELIALLNLSSWCLVMIERLFLTVPRGCLQFVIVVFPDHTHYFCSLEGQFESKIESWKIRKKGCLAIRLIVTVSMLYQFPSGCTANLRLFFCMCKNATQFVLDISMISSFFSLNIYLSIDTQPRLSWTC